MGPALAIASHAAAQGPSGFSLAVMSTASGGILVGKGRPPRRDCAHAKCDSVRIGTAPTAAVAICMNDRRDTRIPFSICASFGSLLVGAQSALDWQRKVIKVNLAWNVVRDNFSLLITL